MKRYALVVVMVLVPQGCLGAEKEIFTLADPRTMVAEGGAPVLMSEEGTPLSEGNVERKEHLASVLGTERGRLFATEETFPISRKDIVKLQIEHEEKPPEEVRERNGVWNHRTIKRSQSGPVGNELVRARMAAFQAACSRCPKSAATARDGAAS